MLLKFINNSIKKYFDSDPEVSAQIHELEGQQLLLKVTDLKKEFLITPVNSSIIVTNYQDDEAVKEVATTIHANVITLLRLAIGADYQSMLNNDTLKIDGDVELANRLRTIFMKVDIDWEEVASKYVGDALAYKLGVLARRTKSYKQRSIENFRLDVREYMQEESRIVPTRIEIERFLNDVDALDADIDRLEARLRRLAQACSQ